MKNICIFEQISKTSLGLFFLIVTAGFMLSGITVLPLFGFLLAVPALLASIYFFSAHLNKGCEIEVE
jgi:hypothetical protein